MKARLLKELLNNTMYSVSNNREYIAVGSPLCHDLISVNKKTLKVKYALDTFREGRKCLEGKSNQELLFIWDKLHELIESGQIKDIINGKDEIENPLPVFTVEDGKLIESVTDAYGWPNTDNDGVCMHDNTHFPTAEKAIEYGINEYNAGVSITLRSIEELEVEMSRIKNRLEKYRGYISDLEQLKNQNR